MVTGHLKALIAGAEHALNERPAPQDPRIGEHGFLSATDGTDLGPAAERADQSTPYEARPVALRDPFLHIAPVRADGVPLLAAEPAQDISPILP